MPVPKSLFTIYKPNSEIFQKYFRTMGPKLLGPIEHIEYVVFTTQTGKVPNNIFLERKAATARKLEQAFQINGPRISNCLPAKLRNISKVGLDEFKMALDKFLETVPDQPKIDGLTPGTQNLTGVYFNYILHQTKRGQGGGLLPNPRAQGRALQCFIA